MDIHVCRWFTNQSHLAFFCIQKQWIWFASCILFIIELLELSMHANVLFWMFFTIQNEAQENKGGRLSKDDSMPSQSEFFIVHDNYAEVLI